MASQKDKDYHKLRNPKKYGLASDSGYKRIVDSVPDENGMHTLIWESIPKTKEDAEADEAYDKLWAKYGHKSMVSDKRRRCSTRNSNQQFKKTMRRIERARGKEEARDEINGNLFCK